ncbi:MAG: PP2C family protein-serine/threonine phosphatase [Planctomycetota bacterium]
MDSDTIRILLVEDDPDDVWLIRHLLGDRWEVPYELVHVDHLAAAIEVCSEATFDVVLVDLSLPDSRGLDTFRAIQHYVRRVPIVVLSGHDSQDIAVRAVQEGAEDYLVKGQVNDLVLARSIRYAIERHRRRQAEENLRVREEADRLAHEIQQRLYPAESPEFPGFDIAGGLYPAEATAGDYFDYIPLLDGSLAVVVGDVSSHGIGPALLMSETRACLRTLAQVHVDVGEMLTRTNRLLIADTSDFHFVTLAMVRIDPATRAMVYASAGQRGYLIEENGTSRVLDSTSLPLGIRDVAAVPVAPPVVLKPGEIVAFFTDGLVEAESPGHVRFGVGRALSIIRRWRECPAAAIVERLRAEVFDFARNQPHRDDITVVVVKVLGEERTESDAGA